MRESQVSEKKALKAWDDNTARRLLFLIKNNLRSHLTVVDNERSYWKNTETFMIFSVWSDRNIKR